jgi:flagellin FlaB
MNKTTMKKDKGMMGIGTLIVFIAILIVAAVAASILISTSGTFGTRALATQKGTEEEISTGMIISSVIGMNGTDGSVETLEIMARLRTGSDPINFNKTVITVDTMEGSQLMTYSGDNTTSTGLFYVNYLQEGTAHIDGYLSLGDTAIISVNLPQAIVEHVSLTIQIIPRVGGITKIRFTTPTSILYYRIFLYP